MRISSKSILSPGRVGSGSGSASGSIRDPPPITLTTSLSRRLKTSRSIRGGASPAMFPATGKKRGGFENPEPSSPKVTCIGQVRVMSKKKHHPKTVRSLSSRRRSSGYVHFRKLDHSRSQSQSQSQNHHVFHHNQECIPVQNNNNNNNNQRWVHLPLTICEALRTFGSEVSCLFPCRSSCSYEKEEKTVAESVQGGNHRQGSCGAVFARWLVALQDGDGGGGGGGRKEIELVAGDDDGDNDEYEEIGVRNIRRHVFEDLEIVNDSVLGNIDEGRVSICVPPKNALLLMRCRSDPVKMETLTNRFMEKSEELFDDDEEVIEENEVVQENLVIQEEEKVMVFVEGNDEENEDEVDKEKIETNLEMEMKKDVQEEEVEIKENVQEDDVEMNPEMEKKQSVEEKEDYQEQSIETIEEEEDESMFIWCLFEENENNNQNQELEEDDFDMEDALRELFKEEDVEEVEEIETGESNLEQVKDFEVKIEEELVTKFTERMEEVENGENEEREKLPQCLLLMMYEPKLSMEVSKETWVCSTDFIRRHSSRKKPPQPPVAVKSVNDQDESKVDSYIQPARSSCSFHAPPSMATMLEQKLTKTTNGYKPLVLTRCKSEPMRTADTKLAPEPCFWTNKLEPPRRASFGISMAGLGLGF